MIDTKSVTNEGTLQRRCKEIDMPMTSEARCTSCRTVTTPMHQFADGLFCWRCCPNCSRTPGRTVARSEFVQNGAHCGAEGECGSDSLTEQLRPAIQESIRT
jgi:hypothetical protein